ncbi:MAG: hypothetical protein JWQ35_812 [Bacteriovoracaceae bacterium]|nr:hypothetical protein [Bacteriovoracaceae bacterium]
MNFISEYFDFKTHPGIPFILIGMLILLWSLRRLSRKSKDKNLDQKPKNWI